jgi:hypothetical protein
MNKSIAINPEKIKEFFGGMVGYLARKPFFSFFLLLMISLIAGTIIFYKYGIIADYSGSGNKESVYKFESKNYRDIMGEWEKRAQNFSGLEKKKYLDPFRLTNPPK